MIDSKAEFVRFGLNVAVAGFLAACTAPERNGSKIPQSQPMPQRPNLEFRETRCFADGLSHSIAVDPEGNEYVVDAQEDERCRGWREGLELTVTPQIVATPTP